MPDEPPPPPPSIRAAEGLLPGGADLDATVRFFTGELGFRIETVFPADDPREVVVGGHGVRLRLVRGAGLDPGVLQLHGEPLRAEAVDRHAPNGTRVVFAPAAPPEPEPGPVPFQVPFQVRRAASGGNAGGAGGWVVGRAGMRYRDLVPGRLGGRIAASHIRIDQAGAVPDYVHHHQVRFQVIYCYRGWVRVVYEDQGPAFVMRAGDCVLQPPGIRHRVLESSAGLQVIEVSAPAEHLTHADPELPLPTAVVRPEREFAGQRFLHHVAESADWRPFDGVESRDSGIAAASAGAVDLRVLRFPPGLDGCASRRARGGFELAFLLAGAATLRRDGAATRLTAGDAVVLPGGDEHRLTDPEEGTEVLLVSAPG